MRSSWHILFTGYREVEFIALNKTSSIKFYGHGHAHSVCADERTKCSLLII